MKEMVSPIFGNFQADWQHTAWYHALTLGERIPTEPLVESATAVEREVAMRRLQKWKEQLPFSEEGYFAERLAQNQLDEETLLALLSESGEALQQRIPTPQWLTEIHDALFSPEALAQYNPPTGQELDILLNTIRPLIQHGVRCLRTRIATLVQEYTHLPFDPQAVVGMLMANLPARLIPLVGRTMVLELNVARLQGRLVGETAEERFRSFVQQTAEPRNLLPLLEEYPVLGRQIMIALQNWITSGVEFLQHLCADWSCLCTTFGIDATDTLTEIQGDAGDSHRGGRSVLVITFQSGQRLVYKPKSMSIDVHFQELLTWLNEHGDHPAFRTLKVVDRHTYGWSEFVVAHGCSTKDEVARFYERQGGYLALLYALEATDFHFENLIASGEHPIMIDLEALFHPRALGNNQKEQASMATEAMHFSVLRVGLLPQLMFVSEDEGLDLSGIGGRGGQFTPHPVADWQDMGTDRMRLVRQRKEIAGKDNRPTLNGTDVEIQDYSDAITTGFTKIYRLMITHREALLDGPIARFAHDEIRLIIRPTRNYAQLLREGSHPDLVRDALERDRFFDYLWAIVPQQPYIKHMVAAEQADLQRGDIPMFTTYPDTRDAFTSQGERIADIIDEPSLETTRKRTLRLDEQDLTRQTWFIHASLATMAMGTDEATWKRSLLLPSTTKVTRERLVQAACAVGDRIGEMALGDGASADWLGVNLVGEHQWMLLPANAEMYNGSYGIILFLSYLGKLTGEQRYTDLARLAFQTALPAVERLKGNLKSIGGFDGWGSHVYLLSHLATLWDDPALFASALESVEIIFEQIEQDQALDVISGAAGSILSMLSLYHVHPTERLRETMLKAGEHILAHAHPMEQGIGWNTAMGKDVPLTGFSHGSTGFAYSLLALAELSGDQRFRQCALDALTYERSMFSAEKQNWPDLRSLAKKKQARPDESGHTYMTAWCHGASGIGLGRLASLQYIDDALIRQEIAIAINTTLAEGFGMNHCLCHGDMGGLEVLLVASRTLGEQQYHEQLTAMTAMVLDSIDTQGWIPGIPFGVESPGLMTGLAGIGYELLRLAEPDRVPSVLLLDKPVQTSSSAPRQRSEREA